MQNIENFHGHRSLEAANSYFLIGLYYNEQDQLAKSLACFNKSLALREYNLGIEHQVCADCLFNIGLVEKKLLYHERAAQDIMKAVKIWQNTIG